MILAQVNLLIDEELLFHNELKNYKLYHDDCRLTQCFNYQKYGHITKICYDTQKCETCAISRHNDHDYMLKGNSFMHWCANCNLEHQA